MLAPIDSDGRPILRRSAAYFHDGNADAVISCLPGCADETNPARTEPMSVADHISAGCVVLADSSRTPRHIGKRRGCAQSYRWIAASTVTHTGVVTQSAAPEADRPAFVLHEHQRPQHHFDLRLERHGVLESWALPKGLPTDPTRNRLAVGVPDHELEHLTYRDADKSIADIGWWEEHDRTDRRFVFTLHGRAGSERYALIRTPRNWLLHLMRTSAPEGNSTVSGE